jgi:hypothetical protein
MIMRAKRNLTARGLRKAVIGNGGTSGDPWMLVTTFGHGGGTADALGREVIAVLNMHELAEIVGRIPMGIIAKDGLTPEQNARRLNAVHLVGSMLGAEAVPGR